MYKHTCQEISNSELITLAQTSHQQAAPHICRSKGKNRTIKRTFFVSTLCRDRLAGSPNSSGGGSHRKMPNEILSATEIGVLKTLWHEKRLSHSLQRLGENPLTVEEDPSILTHLTWPWEQSFSLRDPSQQPQHTCTGTSMHPQKRDPL